MAKTAAPEPVVFDMPYEGPCPECQAAVGFAMSHGGIVCASGEHRFERWPLTDAPGTAEGVLPQPEVASGSPQGSQDAGAVSLTGFSIKTHGGAGKVNPTQAQQIKARMAEVLQDKMRENARRPADVVERLQKRLEDSSKRLESDLHRALSGRPVQVLDAKPAPAGELVVTLRLLEPHRQAVEAEAGVQKQTVEQYLQDWITTALDNYWGR